MRDGYLEPGNVLHQYMARPLRRGYFWKDGLYEMQKRLGTRIACPFGVRVEHCVRLACRREEPQICPQVAYIGCC